jgi:hypothetical protein
MKSGLCAGGLNAEGSISAGRMARHEVRESGERPSSTTTIWWACGWSERVTIKGGMDSCGECERLYGFVTEVCRDGLPLASVVEFHEGEEEL